MRDRNQSQKLSDFLLFLRPLFSVLLLCHWMMPFAYNVAAESQLVLNPFHLVSMPWRDKCVCVLFHLRRQHCARKSLPSHCSLQTDEFYGLRLMLWNVVKRNYADPNDTCWWIPSRDEFSTSLMRNFSQHISHIELSLSATEKHLESIFQNFRFVFFVLCAFFPHQIPDQLFVCA